jgi:EAL domain-containing protein (putative c-di-GMP-specific phosphodiesterase class I)
MGRAYGLRVLANLKKPLVRSVLEPLLLTITTETRVAKPKTTGTKAATLDVRQCLTDGRFVPYFQPKLRFADRAVASAETLIRLEGDDGNILSPDQFLPDVLAQGLITEVTLALFDATLSIVADWNRTGHYPHISFNLSPESLDDVAFGAQLNRRVNAVGIRPSDITFEIVESEISRDFRNALENTTRLRMLGFGLSIDDFGTGFSSVEQLGALPFSELKVDRSFVTGICDDPQKQAMVTATVRMAKDLGLTVVAEGIETDREADFAREAGCDFGQGYWLSRPIAAPACQKFLVTHGGAA